MSLLFLDTSAVAKRYLAELGSTWIIRVVEQATGNIIVIADVATVEMFSLLARRVREGILSSTESRSLGNAFLVHAESAYLTAPLDDPTLVRARALVGQHPLRALDAIQLASAQVAQSVLGNPIIFVSSDRNLLSAANAEGFLTDDPLAHP